MRRRPVRPPSGCGKKGRRNHQRGGRVGHGAGGGVEGPDVGEAVVADRPGGRYQGSARNFRCWCWWRKRCGASIITVGCGRRRATGVIGDPLGDPACTVLSVLRRCGGSCSRWTRRPPPPARSSPRPWPPPAGPPGRVPDGLLKAGRRERGGADPLDDGGGWLRHHGFVLIFVTVMTRNQALWKTSSVTQRDWSSRCPPRDSCPAGRWTCTWRTPRRGSGWSR